MGYFFIILGVIFIALGSMSFWYGGKLIQDEVGRKSTHKIVKSIEVSKEEQQKNHFPFLNIKTETILDPEKKGALVKTRFTLRNSSKQKILNFEWKTEIKNNDNIKTDITLVRSDWIPEEKREFETKFLIPLNQQQFASIKQLYQNSIQTEIRKALQQIIIGAIYLNINMGYKATNGEYIPIGRKILKFNFTENNWVDFAD